MKPATKIVRLNGSEYHDLLNAGWVEWDNDGRSAIMVHIDNAVGFGQG